MKKNIFTLALLCCAVVAMSGCSSVEVATGFHGMAPVVADATGVAHIYSKIPGIYFFNLPVITGAVSNPRAVSFFKDNASVSAAFSQMNVAASDLGAKGVVDASSEVTSYPVFLFLFWWRVAEVSGTAVR